MDNEQIRSTKPVGQRHITPKWVWECCKTDPSDTAQKVIDAIADGACIDPKECCRIVRAFQEIE